MTPYEEKNVFLTKIGLLLTFLAICAASYFAYQQNLINQQLTNANYEPALSIQFVKPDTETKSWINIKNDGKSNIVFYGFSLGATTSTIDITRVEQEVINVSSFSIILAGSSINMADNPSLSIIKQVMSNKNVNVTVPIYVYFKTGNGKKYIMQTWVHIFSVPNGIEVDNGPINYREFNWKENQ